MIVFQEFDLYMILNLGVDNHIESNFCASFSFFSSYNAYPFTYITPHSTAVSVFAAQSGKFFFQVLSRNTLPYHIRSETNNPETGISGISVTIRI